MKLWKVFLLYCFKSTHPNECAWFQSCCPFPVQLFLIYLLFWYATYMHYYPYCLDTAYLPDPRIRILRDPACRIPGSGSCVWHFLPYRSIYFIEGDIFYTEQKDHANNEFEMERIKLFKRMAQQN